MLKDQSLYEVDLLINRYPILLKNKESIIDAIELLYKSIKNEGKLLICGNGGSAADCIHIVGELMKSFVLPRKLPQNIQDDLKYNYPEFADLYINNLQRGIPAVSLCSEVGLTTAYNNDCSSELVYAQQVLGYGEQNDVLIAISTSGNSKNIIHAVNIAKVLGIKVIALTGEGGGKLKNIADILIDVNNKVTYQIQELHLPIYHTLCLALEKEMFME